MMDSFYLLISLVFFVIAAAYVQACDRL